VVYLKRQVRSHHTAKNAPHRAMNRFETAAISKLPAARAAADIPARWRISPEDVIVERQSNGDVRVLGAIRTTKSCYDCHATKEGELLGAFTYTLRKTTRQAELTKKLLQARPSTSEPTQGF
ncbi:MAG TPA: hypothetical protein VEJ63_01740, partial [Planctomycetota bacterium]|nr:hypothetical protein [Planctomycetota bacterium]